MSQKAYLFISGVVFGVVGLSHLLRAAYQVPVTAGDWVFPIPFSWAGGIVALGLGAWGFTLIRRSP